MQDKYKINAYMLPFLTAIETRNTKNTYVYFMFAEDSDTLLYIGQTHNMKQRIQGHNATLDDMAKTLEDETLRNVCYKAIKVDANDLDEVEKYYIKRYCPPRNVAHNSPDVIRAYELWYYEKLLTAYNKNRVLDGEKPLSFEEAYGGKMGHTA